MFLLTGVAAAKEMVVVYTSLENEEVVEYLKVAKKELPDIDIQAIRLSTGELGARMLAEKDNPQADCIWGWAVTNMSEFVPKGMLEPYQPAGWENGARNRKPGTRNGRSEPNGGPGTYTAWCSRRRLTRTSTPNTVTPAAATMGVRTRSAWSPNRSTTVPPAALPVTEANPK